MTKRLLLSAVLLLLMAAGCPAQVLSIHKTNGEVTACPVDSIEYINFIGLPGTLATCSDVIAGPEGVSYRVEGTVSRIANEKYGNFMLTDETGEIYIYGTQDSEGQWCFPTLGIEVGDVVVVEGAKKLYNTTVELVNVQVQDIYKSRLSVEGDTDISIADGGASFTVRLNVKGSAPTVSISDDAQSWLRFTGTEAEGGYTVAYFRADANTDLRARTATVRFTSSADGHTTILPVTVTQKGQTTSAGHSPETAFTVGQAIAYIDAGGTDEVYVQGTVSKIVYTFSANYGTGTFWISADGEHHGDAQLDFEAYSIYWLGNRSWVEGDGQVAEGDKVILCGQLTKYKTTYETSSKKAYIYSINGRTE